MGNDSKPTYRKYYAVLDKQMFEEIGDGLVKVTNSEGEWGIFRSTGPWVEGPLTQCNIHMLNWTGGNRLSKISNFRWTEYPTDLTRPSNYPADMEKEIPFIVDGGESQD